MDVCASTVCCCHCWPKKILARMAFGWDNISATLLVAWIGPKQSSTFCSHAGWCKSPPKCLVGREFVSANLAAALAVAMAVPPLPCHDRYHDDGDDRYHEYHDDGDDRYHDDGDDTQTMVTPTVTMTQVLIPTIMWEHMISSESKTANTKTLCGSAASADCWHPWAKMSPFKYSKKAYMIQWVWDLF